MQSLISKISHIFLEICDIKRRFEPRTIQGLQHTTSSSKPHWILKANRYSSTHLGQDDKKDWNYTPEQSNNSSAREGMDDLGDTCSTHNIQYHHSPNNPHNSLCHASIPPSLSPCQELGLVAFMFFFELLFSYVSFAISFYVFFLNLFSITPSLTCFLPETLKTRDSKKAIHLVIGKV